MTDSYFGSIGQFEQQQRQRRQRMAQIFFDQHPKPIRQLLLDTCRQDLIDLGIHIQCEQSVEDQVEIDRLLALQLQHEEDPK